MTLSIIVAVADNGVIGKDGKIPWRLPEDQANFKRITMGHPIVMGRSTFESLRRPLPGRTNIVVSRTLSPREGVIVCRSIEEAIEHAHEIDPDGEAFSIGGESVYRQTLPIADKLYLSAVHGNFEGDTFFPEFSPRYWSLIEDEPHEGYTFRRYDRIR